MSELGTFTITELGRVGSRTGGRPDGGEGEVFEWTSDRSPSDPSRGGARAIPRRGWAQGGKLRTVRTDYPGSRTPSEQVLGPHHKQQSLQGKWDDRYNFPGFARNEMRRFDAMCRRGNLVRISFQEITYESIIVEWDFDYRRDWDIGYSFTLSVHDRTDDFSVQDRSPQTARSPAEAFDDVNDLVNAIGLQSEDSLRQASLEASMQGDAVDAAKAAILSMESSRDSLGDTLDQRELNVDASGGAGALSPFSRLATQFRSVRGDVSSLIGGLIAVRSDTHLTARTALSVLSFEDWSRSLRFQGRVLLGESQESGDDMDKRAAPDARRLYRPFRGESMYSVSRRFYGTPHSWRLIADRNQISDFELTGDELLIIPERGTG